MKAILLAGLYIAMSITPDWISDFNKAQEIARTENRLILLNFSGSDWCAPCIRLKKEIFAADQFNEVADRQLVLVNADFPRNKKNQLSKAQQQQNETLADRYNPEGKFPLTLLLKADGTIIHTWDGFPASGTNKFVTELKDLCNSTINLSK